MSDSAAAFPAYVFYNPALLDSDLGEQEFALDTDRKLCDSDGDEQEEPFAETSTIEFDVRNNLSVSAKIEWVRFRVLSFGKSSKIYINRNLEPKSETSIDVPFALANDNTKILFGTNKTLSAVGHRNARVIFGIRDSRGDFRKVKQSVSIHFAEVDRCPAS